MKKYRVNVNGSLYEIEIEEMSAPATMSAPAAAPKAAAPVAAAPAGGAQVKAPMPGTILDVKVQNGQSVKKGTVLCVLEAMKMENEIQAPCDGKVGSLNVRKGDSVETQSLICTIG
jgi:biotin carboxyl carrier protein